MLRGKTVIVTGASRGIGKAIALEFAKRNANIAFNYTKDTPPMDVIREIEREDVVCFAAKSDVSSFEESKSFVDQVMEKFGTVDILVNNAGVTRDNLLLRMSEEDFDKVISINLKGAFNFTKHVSKIMLKQRSGVIINISSVVGLMGNVGQANYSASKAGLIGFTKSCARELAPRGVRCNCIAPGFIETDMTKELTDAMKEKYIDNIPLKRLGTVEDISKAALFLADHDYITGQVICIDGGLIMQ